MPKPPHTMNDALPRIEVQRQNGADAHDTLLHERAVLCARLARLLTAALSRLDWQALRFADRSRLARTLARLTGDAHLAALTEGGGNRKSGTAPETQTPPARPCSPE